MTSFEDARRQRGEQPAAHQTRELCSEGELQGSRSLPSGAPRRPCPLGHHRASLVGSHSLLSKAGAALGRNVPEELLTYLRL